MAGPHAGGRPVADPYQLLGVGRDASRAQITHAYRRGARALHPDSQPGDADAAARFGELSDAYQLLSDPARRAEYDRWVRTRTAPAAGTGRGPRSAPPASGTGRPAPPDRIPSPPAPPAAAALWPIPEPGGPLAPRPMLWAGPVRVEPPGHRGLPGDEPPLTSVPRRTPGGSDPLLAALADLLAGRGSDPGYWPW